MEEVDILEHPAVHQIIVLDFTPGTYAHALDAAREAMVYLARQVNVPSSTSEILSAAQDLTPKERPKRDQRQRVATAKRLYPIAEGECLHVAYYVVQDGTALIVQLIWYYQGTDARDNSLFSQDSKEQWTKRLWQIPAGFDDIVVGQSRLLTAARSSGPTGPDSGGQILPVTPSPQNILGLFSSEADATRLVPVVLPGVTIYAPLYTSLALKTNQSQFTTLILFDSLKIEQSRAADRWVLDEWPLITKYQLRLHNLYHRDYAPPRHDTSERSLKSMFESLIEVTRAASETLQTTMGRQAQPNKKSRGPFRTSNVHDLHSKLASLGEQQYYLLALLKDAEKALHEGQTDLHNLEEHIRRLFTLTPLHEGSPQVTPDGPVFALTERARHYADQIASDVLEARQVANHFSRSIDLLRGQADTLKAAYEGSLARIGMLVAIVGTALGAVQILDAPVVQFLYRDWHLSYWVDFITGIPMQKDNEGAAFLLVRLIVVAFVVILFLLINWLIGWIRSWKRI